MLKTNLRLFVISQYYWMVVFAVFTQTIHVHHVDSAIFYWHFLLIIWIGFNHRIRISVDRIDKITYFLIESSCGIRI